MKTKLAGVIALTGALGLAPGALANPLTETLYFTTYSGGSNVWKTTATYNGDGTAGNGTFSPGTPTVVTATPGADGIVENPNNGQLLVGGQGTGNIFQVNTTNGSYTALNAGMSAFEITVDPTGNFIWGGGSENGSTTITEVPINPSGGTPTVVHVTGSNSSVTHITFVPGQAPGTAFYTSGGNGGGGRFGTINLLTGVTTALTSGVTWAHGMVYDPFTGDLIVAGGNEMAQVDPVTHAVISTAFFGSDVLDQGAVDGKGHIFWADNYGHLAFMDYSNTKLIGSSNNFVSNNYYMYSLDDFAPLIGTGGTNNVRVPEPSTLVLFLTGLLGLGMAFRKKLQLG